MTNPNSIRKPKDRLFSPKNPIIYGIFGTVIVFVAYGILATSRSCQKGVCQSNFEHFLASSPNEIGDTLAGVAGILAFHWIIITVFLQSKELRIARKEYEKMADAQTGQLKLLEKQGAIFEKEQEQRNQDSNKDVLDQMLIGVWYRMTTMPLNSSSWYIPDDCYVDQEYSDERPLFQLPETDNTYSLDKTPSAAEREALIRLEAFHLRDVVDELTHCRPTMREDSLPAKSDELDALIYELGQIRKLESVLSAAQKQRLDNLQIGELHIILRTISAKDEWWRANDNEEAS